LIFKSSSEQYQRQIRGLLISGIFFVIMTQRTFDNFRGTNNNTP
jgi:hypothetical protein